MISVIRGYDRVILWPFNDDEIVMYYLLLLLSLIIIYLNASPKMSVIDTGGNTITVIIK